MKKLMAILIVGLALFGCSQERQEENFNVISQSYLGLNSDVTIKELEYVTQKMNDTFSTFSEESLENGIYAYNG